ncbi:MAG TPA: hypothetical protein PK095_25935, partial [Myxococcota bacterium]|nr:hypothetical protein [Myxococcota bacterium]
MSAWGSGRSLSPGFIQEEVEVLVGAWEGAVSDGLQLEVEAIRREGLEVQQRRELGQDESF